MNWHSKFTGTHVNRKDKSVRKSEQVVVVDTGIAITNPCWVCASLDDICPTCQDEYDNKQIVRAYELVDDGNLSQPRPMAWLKEMPSGHDFIGSITRRPDGTLRYEFCEPTVSMEDRIHNPELEVSSKETICQACMYVCWAELPCPNCQEIN